MQEYTKVKYLRLVYLLNFLLLGAVLHAQNNNTPLSLKQRFLQADSIHIASHEDLVLIIDTVPGKKGIYERREIIKKGVLNRDIVRESVTLDCKSIDKLYNILSYGSYEESESLSCSFNPHHAILIYKKGICFCIDVCFTCGGYRTSESLPERSLLTNAESGSQLYDFFRENGILYRIPERNDCSYCMATDYNKNTKHKKSGNH